MPAIKYMPPLGGLKQDLPPQLLQRHFSPSLSGVWPVDGRIRRIPGKQKHSTTQLAGGAVMCLRQFYKEDSNSWLVGISQDKAYKYNTGTKAYDSIQDGTDFTGTANDPFSTASFFDASSDEILIITNYKDTIRKWSGAGAIAELGGTPPKAKCLNVYANFLMLGFTEESSTPYPRRIRWSAMGNGESHPAENYKDFRKTSDWIVALRNLSTRQVIYKERSISFMDYVGGALVFDVDENYVIGTGPLNEGCIVLFEQEHVFLGYDLNIYAFNGIDYRAISSNIDNLIKNLHPDYKKNACGMLVKEENKIVWAVPRAGDTTNKTLIILDTKDRTFWVKDNEPVGISCLGNALLEASYTWDTHPAPTWDEWDDPDGWDSRQLLQNAPTVLLGCSDGYVRRLAAGANDDGSALPSHYCWPWDNLDGDDETIKLVTKIVIEVAREGSGTITFEAFVDQDESSAVILDESANNSKLIDLYGENSNAKYLYHAIDCVILGYNFMWRLSSTNAVWSARIVGVEFEIAGRKIVPDWGDVEFVEPGDEAGLLLETGEGILTEGGDKILLE